MKTTPYTPTLRLNQAPRCLAKTRRGTPCQSPAVHGKKRCRMHGCGKGSGAPKNNTYAVTHGMTSIFVKHLKKEIKQQINKSKNMFQIIS